MSNEKEKANPQGEDSKKEISVLGLPPLKFSNHEEVIYQLAEQARVRSDTEEQLFFLEWIKNRYLTKVRLEHPLEGDTEAVRLNRVVYSGRLRELVFEHYEQRRRRMEKDKRSCCSCCSQ